MVGTLVSFCDGLFSGAMLVSGSALRIYMCARHEHEPLTYETMWQYIYIYIKMKMMRPNRHKPFGESFPFMLGLPFETSPGWFDANCSPLSSQHTMGTETEINSEMHRMTELLYPSPVKNPCIVFIYIPTFVTIWLNFMRHVGKYAIYVWRHFFWGLEFTVRKL